MGKYGKNLAVWIVIALLLVALFNLFQSSTPRPSLPTLAYSEFLSQLDDGEVKHVRISGRWLTIGLADGHVFNSYAPDDPTLLQRLGARNVRFDAVPPDNDDAPSLLSILVSWLPLLVLGGVWWFFMRLAQARNPTAQYLARLDELVEQLRMMNTRLGEIQGTLAHPPSRPDQAETDREQRF